MLVTLCLVSAIVGFMLPFLSSEQYTASALILVRPAKTIEHSQKGGREVLNVPIGVTQTETPGKTYIELAKSYTVIERVTKLLQLHVEEPESDEGVLGALGNQAKAIVRHIAQFVKYGRTFEIDRFRETVEAVQEDLDLATTLETYVFSISFETDEPQKAADVVNAVATVFMDYLVELNRSESREVLAYLQGELDKAHQGLIEAGRELQAFKDARGIYSAMVEHREKLKVLTELEIDYEKTKSTLASALQKRSRAHPDVSALESQQKYLDSAIVRRRTDLKRMPEAEAKMRLLELRIETASEAYQFLRREHQEAEVRAARGLPETVLVAPAVPPLNPSRPRHMLSAILSLIAALLVGLLLIFLAEFFDTTIQSVDDASGALDVPVLATVPALPPDL